MHVKRLTIRESAETIQRRFGGRLLPEWRVRRVVDSLEATNSLNVHRFGRYRTVSADDIEIIVTELHRLGCLESEAVRA